MGGWGENGGLRPAGKNNPLRREFHRALFEERAGLKGKAVHAWANSILGAGFISFAVVSLRTYPRSENAISRLENEVCHEP